MTRLSDIRKSIEKQRGIEFKRLSRAPITFDQVSTPFSKTQLMQLLELRYKARIESLIFSGTIYEVEKRLGVDATTISKWRKLITEARNKEFFAQFEGGNNGDSEHTGR